MSVNDTKSNPNWENTLCPKCSHPIARHKNVGYTPFDTTTLAYGMCFQIGDGRYDMDGYLRSSRCICDLTPDDAWRNFVLIAERKAKEAEAEKIAKED